MVDVEKQCNPHQLMAEIVHLPESRVGNILMRPALREYEIPYLAKSIVPPENQLPLEDLMLSVRKGRLFLRSKKHDTEVLPRLTNAHNYSSGALPIYQFLANMQNQDKRPGVFFRWGPFENTFPFLPRVTYKEVILAPKTWNMSDKDLKQLQQSQHDTALLQKHIDDFIIAKALPTYVLLKERDNELLINLKNLTSVQMLLVTVKNKKRFILTEFLHATGTESTIPEHYHTNQVVLSFYNESRLITAQDG